MWARLTENKVFRGAMGYVSLFTSFGTLLCCALPSMLVLLGFGAGVAGFVGKYPQLIWLSEHKAWIFGISFAMLGLSFLSQKYADVCPIDKREECQSAKKWSKPLLYVTLSINVIGAFYAFILPRIL